MGPVETEGIEEKKREDLNPDMQKKGLRYVAREDAEFPARLLCIPQPPKGLYVIGDFPREDLPSVAIIGARDCSLYGENVARILGKRLGEKGIQVISGMARGIDGIGQEAALLAGGRSFGVLGCGVDICYPKSNLRLYERLKVQGGLISEFPPGTMPRAQHFPSRNRIVSGLSDIVVVVQARVKSGTLITVDMALDQGREVYVVPGRITDALSAGCNRLMKMGAGILLDTEEFLEELAGIHARGMAERAQRAEELACERRALNEFEKSGKERTVKEHCPRELSPELAAIWRVLDDVPKELEAIRGELPEEFRNGPLPLYLVQLCMEGVAEQKSPGYFSKISKLV